MYDSLAGKCKCDTGYKEFFAVGGSPTCATVCGDGIRIENIEACDDGNLMDKDGCSSSCLK